MNGTEFKLGGQVFTTKTAVRDAVRTLLHGVPAGREVPETADPFLRDLLELHPEADEKIGIGVDHFEVRTNRVNGGATPGFWVVRCDGSATDFSYKSCIDGKKQAPKDEFIRACRQAIQAHITEDRQRFFAEAPAPTCALTGVPLTHKTAHVDHCPPYTFARIVEAFVVLHGLDINNPRLIDNGGDGVMIPTFADLTLREKFIQFHNNHAKLRVISTAANMTIVPAAAQVALL